MAINKKLIHFLTGASFDKELKAGNILDTSICFIKDRQQIYTHEQFYDCFGLSKEEIIKLIESFLVEIDANGYEYVDLGLPSGTLWATCNVGANKPEEAGLYFLWGDTEGWRADLVGVEKIFDWSDYKWCNGTKETLTKYCTKSNYGTVDNKLLLELEDDAAHVNMGGDWRMPTNEDLKEILDNCTYSYVENYNESGVDGFLFTSKINSNILFLPTVGRATVEIVTDKFKGYYWTSDLDDLITYNGYYLYLSLVQNNWEALDDCTTSRNQGSSVRGVIQSKVEKYLTKKEFNEFINSFESDWEALEEEQGFIKNKPFYDNGNIEVVNIDSSTETFIPSVSIYPANCLLEEGKEYTITIDGKSYKRTAYTNLTTSTMIENALLEFGLVATNVLILSDVVINDLLSIPTWFLAIGEMDGSYFCAILSYSGVDPMDFTLTITTENIKKLDLKFTHNADWDANSGENGFIKNRPFGLVPKENTVYLDERVYVEDNMCGITDLIISEESEDNIEKLLGLMAAVYNSGNKFKITVDGVTKECVTSVLPEVCAVIAPRPIALEEFDYDNLPNLINELGFGILILSDFIFLNDTNGWADVKIEQINDSLTYIDDTITIKNNIIDIDSSDNPEMILYELAALGKSADSATTCEVIFDDEKIDCYISKGVFDGVPIYVIAPGKIPLENILEEGDILMLFYLLMLQKIAIFTADVPIENMGYAEYLIFSNKEDGDYHLKVSLEGLSDIKKIDEKYLPELLKTYTLTIDTITANLDGTYFGEIFGPTQEIYNQFVKNKENISASLDAGKFFHKIGYGADKIGLINLHEFICCYRKLVLNGLILDEEEGAKYPPYTVAIDIYENGITLYRIRPFTTGEVTKAELEEATKNLVTKDELLEAIESVDVTYDDTEIRESIESLNDRVDDVEDVLYTSIGEAGDVVLVNNITLEKIAVNPNKLKNYSKEDYTPIGVVVIPSSHDVYGTGEAGVISLLAASLNTPDLGQATNVSMYWGNNYVDTELPNFNHLVCYGYMSKDPTDTVTNTVPSGYIPLMRGEMEKGIECSTDPGTWYTSAHAAADGYIPSPYLKDGSRNPDYYKVDPPASIANAMSDFAGKNNTEILISLVTLTDWKTASKINNGSGNGYSPAACTCWRFHTAGTSQGDWYLPAFGELGYYASRFDKINTTLLEIARIYDVPVCLLAEGVTYWSSTEKESTKVWIISFTKGYVYYKDKNLSGHTRPLTRIKFDSLSNNRLDIHIKESKEKFLQTLQEANNYTDSRCDKLDNITKEVEDRLDTLEEAVFETIYAKVGDIVLVDNNTLLKVCVNPDDLSSYVNTHTPIGVVVVPTAHDVYETGECGVMSLNCMSTQTPDTGASVEEHMYFGNVSKLFDNSIAGLASYGFMNSPVKDTIQSNWFLAALSRTDLTGQQDPKRDGYRYYNNNPSDWVYGPSPTLTDGSRNPDYYSKWEEKGYGGNAFSDFNGIENTIVYLNEAINQPNWKTDTTIINNMENGYSPGACCAWRYHTLGTNLGDWYVPACGELGYAVQDYPTLKNSIQKINSLYPSVTAFITDSASSTNLGMGEVRGTAHNLGAMTRYGKDTLRPVVAFTRVKFNRTYLDKHITEAEQQFNEINEKLNNLSDLSYDNLTSEVSSVDDFELNLDTILLDDIEFSEQREYDPGTYLRELNLNGCTLDNINLRNATFTDAIRDGYLKNALFYSVTATLENVSAMNLNLDSSTITITGEGEYSNLEVKDCDLIIKGGTFINWNPSEYVPKGYKVEISGDKYNVIKG